MMLRLGTILLAGLLSACAVTPRETPAPVEDRDVPSVEVPRPPVFGPPPAEPQRAPETAPAPPVRSTPPAATPASTLLTSIDSAVAAGELERAIALSERALRITPRDARLWYRLASIHFQQRNYSEAAGFARRGLSFAAAEPALARDLNALLERATAAQQRR